MKKFFLVFSTVLFVSFLSIIILIKVNEERLVRTFKYRIINKTTLNIDFEEIHFSLIRYFPYGSFTLDNANIFYSKHSRKDTLLSAKKLSFKINTINLFKNIYEFPEIIVSDGSISIKGEMVDTLFATSSGSNAKNKYLFDFKSIRLIRCKMEYLQRNTIDLYFYTEQSTFSGSFVPNALSLRLNMNVSRVIGFLNGLKFKTNDLIKVTSNVRHHDNSFFSESGKISVGSIGLDFSFHYKTKENQLQIGTKAERILAKSFCKQLLKNIKIPITKGYLTFESLYSINLNVSQSQKLTLKYNLENIAVEGFKNLTILNLKGKTSYTNNFNRNSSEINSYLIHYNGFELSGSSMIRDFPKPTILIDSKIKSIGEMLITDSLSLNGNLNGNLKALVKVNNINKLDYSSLKISKIHSDLTLTNIVIKNIDYVKYISGSLLIDNDELEFNGKGTLYNEPFEGNLALPNFMNVAFHEAKPTPKISLAMDRMNLDSILKAESSNSSSLIDYQLKSKIKSLKVKGVEINDLDINLTYMNNRYCSDYFKLKALDGTINGTFTYSNDDINSLSFTGQGIDIQKLFKNFNNFKQEVVTSKNISGSVSGKVDMSYRLLNKKIDPSSIKMVSSITIENGKLSGVKQLKRVSNFLNISEIDSFRFKTIQNRINIENGMIQIPSMDVASNALNFQVSGQHGFDGEFTYWVKLYLKEILAKKYLFKKEYNSDYKKDSKNGLNLFLKIYGNNETLKVGFDKKNTIESIKSNFNQEGILLKSIIKEEFGRSKLSKDTLLPNGLNKVDSTHNKKQKKPFRIEWDEMDTTKNKNQ